MFIQNKIRLLQVEKFITVSFLLSACVSFVESVIGKVTVEDEEESDNILEKILYTPVYPYISVHQNTDMFCVDIPS